MSASNDLRQYASNRVFDGTRPLSAARANKLRARHQRPQARRASLVAYVATYGAVIVQFAKALLPHHT